VPAAGGRSFRVSPGILATTTSTEAATPVQSTVVAIARPRVVGCGAGRGAGDEVSAPALARHLTERQGDDAAVALDVDGPGDPVPSRLLSTRVLISRKSAPVDPGKIEFRREEDQRSRAPRRLHAEVQPVYGVDEAKPTHDRIPAGVLADGENDFLSGAEVDDVQARSQVARIYEVDANPAKDAEVPGLHVCGLRRYRPGVQERPDPAS
jgi:hypothetical protein